MAEIRIKPLRDFILVSPKEVEKTPSGIIIPEKAQEKPQEGTVIAVGPGKKDEPMNLKPGDTILFSSYSTKTYKDGDKTYLLMHESDAYAVVYND